MAFDGLRCADRSYKDLPDNLVRGEGAEGKQRRGGRASLLRGEDGPGNVAPVSKMPVSIGGPDSSNSSVPPDEQPSDAVTPMGNNEQDEAIERLNNLGHLSAGVGHHVINAFSAIVSNAELLRLKPPIPSVVDPGGLADTTARTSLDAATVARRLIDYTRPVTSTDPDTS